MKNTKTKLLKKMKALAIIALVFSVILTAFLLYQSSLDKEESNKISKYVRDVIQEVFNLQEERSRPR